jgi:hypothetical protein
VILALRPRADVELLGHACDVAARSHQGQTRLSGHPYITHPVAVATILAGLEETAGVDDQMLCAAVMHDTVEDTPYTLAAETRLRRRSRDDGDTAHGAGSAQPAARTHRQPDHGGYRIGRY